MKKLIGTVAVAALLASAAFAELSFGAWIRTVTAPVASDGEDIMAGWANSWGSTVRNARINLNWTSDDEKVGMMFDIYGDGAGGFGSGDYRAGWYKPADWVKFMVGHIDNGYTMRSDLCLPSWGWLRPANWIEGDEGLTFNLGNADALQIELFPVEGLQVLGRLAMPADGGFQDAYKMFEQSTFAVGYTIGNIGTIKAAWNGSGTRAYKEKGHAAGYLVQLAGDDYYYSSQTALNADIDAAKAKQANGDELSDKETALAASTAPTLGAWTKEVKKSGEEKYYGDIQVAFDLTAVENLDLTVGVKISIASDDFKKLGGGNFALPGTLKSTDKVSEKGMFNTFKGALGASYKINDNFKVSASYAIFLVEFYGSNDDVDPMHQFGVGVEVGLTDSLGLGVDFRGLLPCNDIDPIFSFVVGLDYNFSSNGMLGIGFQGVIAGANYPAVGENGNPARTASVFPARPDKFSWAVPIRFSYWF